MAKSTKATVLQRVQDVYEILLEGGGDEEIGIHATEMGWDVTERQLERYRLKANEQLNLDLSERRDQVLDKCRKRRNYIWHMAKRRKNVNVMLQVVKDEQLLMGAYPESEAALQIRREFDEYKEMMRLALEEALRPRISGPVSDAVVENRPVEKPQVVDVVADAGAPPGAPDDSVGQGDTVESRNGKLATDGEVSPVEDVP